MATSACSVYRDLGFKIFRFLIPALEVLNYNSLFGFSHCVLYYYKENSKLKKGDIALL